MESEKERKTVYTVLIDGDIMDVTTDAWEVGHMVEHAIGMRIGKLNNHCIKIQVEAWSVLI